LLSSAQQTVDKLISQTQDGVKLLRKNELNSPSNDLHNSEIINQAETLIQDSERAKQVRIFKKFTYKCSKVTCYLISDRDRESVAYRNFNMTRKMNTEMKKVLIREIVIEFLL